MDPLWKDEFWVSHTKEGLHEFEYDGSEYTGSFGINRITETYTCKRCSFRIRLSYAKSAKKPAKPLSSWGPHCLSQRLKTVVEG